MEKSLELQVVQYLLPCSLTYSVQLLVQPFLPDRQVTSALLPAARSAIPAVQLRQQLCRQTRPSCLELHS